MIKYVPETKEAGMDPALLKVVGIVIATMAISTIACVTCNEISRRAARLSTEIAARAFGVIVAIGCLVVIGCILAGLGWDMYLLTQEFPQVWAQTPAEGKREVIISFGLALVFIYLYARYLRRWTAGQTDCIIFSVSG